MTVIKIVRCYLFSIEFSGTRPALRCQVSINLYFTTYYNMKKLTASVIAIVAFVALTGVAQAGEVTRPVPDASTTSALMGIALAGLAVVRRFVR
jgi:hypothetical protein